MKFYNLLFLLASLTFCQENTLLTLPREALTELCKKYPDFPTEFKQHFGFHNGTITYDRWPLLQRLLSLVPTPSQKMPFKREAKKGPHKVIFNRKHQVHIYTSNDTTRPELCFKSKNGSVVRKPTSSPITAILSVSDCTCATYSENGDILLWDIPTHAILAHTNIGSRVKSMAFTDPHILCILGSEDIPKIKIQDLFSGVPLQEEILPQFETSDMLFFADAQRLECEGSQLYCTDSAQRTLSYSLMPFSLCKSIIQRKMDWWDIILLTYLANLEEEKRNESDSRKHANTLSLPYMVGIAKKNDAPNLTAWLTIIGNFVFRQKNKNSVLYHTAYLRGIT